MSDGSIFNAYCRLWGRIEGRGYQVVYGSSSDMFGFRGLVRWDLGQVLIHRPEVSGVRGPVQSDPETLAHEFRLLAHELGHLQHREMDERRWIDYFAANCIWHVLRREGRGRELHHDYAKLIYDEEVWAEHLGSETVLELYPQTHDEFKLTAEENLADYRRALGMEGP